jgi:hypothetical protein
VAFLFLLPAAVTLFFAWSVWFANKRPQISLRRLSAFRWGLILASAAYVLFLIAGYHLLLTLEPAVGVWLIGDWFGLALLALSIAGAIAGRGSGRILLLCWAALMFFGVLGITGAMIP